MASVLHRQSIAFSVPHMQRHLFAHERDLDGLIEKHKVGNERAWAMLCACYCGVSQCHSSKHNKVLVIVKERSEVNFLTDALTLVLKKYFSSVVSKAACYGASFAKEIQESKCQDRYYFLVDFKSRDKVDGLNAVFVTGFPEKSTAAFWRQLRNKLVDAPLGEEGGGALWTEISRLLAPWELAEAKRPEEYSEQQVKLSRAAQKRYAKQTSSFGAATTWTTAETYGEVRDFSDLNVKRRRLH